MTKIPENFLDWSPAHRMVREFWIKFEQQPTPDLYGDLVREEAKEVQEAARHFLKEITDLHYVFAGLQILIGNDRAELILDEATRGVSPYITAMMRAIPAEIKAEAYRRVHESNMSKLGEDGQPIKREDGKILKGPNYREPHLTDLI